MKVFDAQTLCLHINDSTCLLCLFSPVARCGVLDLRLRLAASALVANQVTGNKIGNVVAQWVVPGEIFHGDDVVNGGALRVRPLEVQINELVALIADLAGTQNTGLCLFELDASATEGARAVLR